MRHSENLPRPSKETLAVTSEAPAPRRGLVRGNVNDKDDERVLTAHDGAQTPPTVLLGTFHLAENVCPALFRQSVSESAEASASRCEGGGDLQETPLSSVSQWALRGRARGSGSAAIQWASVRVPQRANGRAPRRRWEAAGLQVRCWRGAAEAAVAVAFPLGSKVNAGGGVVRGGRRRPRLAAGSRGGGPAGSNRPRPRSTERPLPEAPPWRVAWPASASPGLPPAESFLPEVRPPLRPLCLCAFPSTVTLGY